jgi:hypothetical protein
MLALQATYNRLMANDKNVLLSLQLHDNGLKTNHHVTIRFPASVPVVKLVVVPISKVFRVRFLFPGQSQQKP